MFYQKISTPLQGPFITSSLKKKSKGSKSHQRTHPFQYRPTWTSKIKNPLHKINFTIYKNVHNCNSSLTKLAVQKTPEKSHEQQQYISNMKVTTSFHQTVQIEDFKHHFDFLKFILNTTDHSMTINILHWYKSVAILSQATMTGSWFVTAFGVLSAYSTSTGT